jgi:hypothetical protein
LSALAFATAAFACGAQTITAAAGWPGNKAQFFLSDGSYVRYDMNKDAADPGYPKKIDDSTWPGMGPYARSIIAAVEVVGTDKGFFFLSDGRYIRYDVGTDRMDPGYPKPIDNRTFPGMGPYAKSIFGAMNWPGGKIQFFLANGTYARYDIKADRLDPGYPKPIDSKTWPGLALYARAISGAFVADNGKAYFFLDSGQYLRYDVKSDRMDPGYPKPIDARTWPGVHGYFARK